MKIDLEVYYEKLIHDLEVKIKILARRKSWRKYYELKMRLAKEKNQLLKIKEAKKINFNILVLLF